MQRNSTINQGTEVLDIVIVGAGLSGIGAAHRLQRDCPDHRLAILESRDAIGGTWDLFRYPGIRSDSDMYTLGYDFKPWTSPKAIADGASIRDYIRETADEAGITAKIRFGHRVCNASWSSAEACWTLDVEHKGERKVLRTRFLYLCSGYYRYSEAHRPEFPEEQQFRGRIVEPQFWPEDLDYGGKQVVVIGSGATAVTLIPEMAKTAAHVTMLQRSPTYVVTRPGVDTVAQGLRRVLPASWAYFLTRWKNVLIGNFYYRLARNRPELFKKRIIEMAAKALGSTQTAAAHFTPSYQPWDQRLCVVPDGDLFRVLRDGRASVATATIERFTPDGIRLSTGQELRADIVVSATGLKLCVMGDIAINIDGKPFDASQALAYRGMMLSDVPNLAWAFGYTNASWTLKVDLTSAYVCRLLRHMRKHRFSTAVPRSESDVKPQPLLDFTSGYVQRAAKILPNQGSRHPWRVHQSYFADLRAIRWGRLEDGVMQFQS